MTRRAVFIPFLLLLLLPLLVLPLLRVDAQTRALLEPADGRVYHGVQTMTFDAGDPVAGYLNALGDSTIQPAVRGLFFSIPGTRGAAASLRQLAGFYAQADSIGFIPELSLFLVSDVATDTVIATSTQYDAIIDSIITLSKAYGRRMFLRIGGEFNGQGEGWNGGGYTPHHYVTMFRKITDMFAARGFRDSVATIWCYYPAAANDFDSVDARGALWYPGDAHVDWFGLDLFNADDFDLAAPDSSRGGISRKGKSERFLAMARAHGKPVYMSETSAKGINISNGPADGIADWNAWFAKFWDFIVAHPEIKGYSYINANWPDRAYPGWGDARIQNSAYVTGQYRGEMRKPRYIHLPTSSSTSGVASDGVARDIAVAVAPHPVRGSAQVRLALPHPQTVRVSLHDLLGREVRQLHAGAMVRGEGWLPLDGADLPAGVYILRVAHDHGGTQHPILVTHE